MKTLSKKRGFTLIEVLITSSILVLALGAMISTMMMSGNLSKKLSNGIVTVDKGRLTADRLVLDAQAADRVLSRYPTSGTAEFISDGGTTIILRIPSATGSDVAIYRTKATTGEAGPFLLERYSARIGPGGDSPATLDGVVARSVGALDLSYTAHEIFLGDGHFRKFALRSAAQGAKPGAPERVLADGDELVKRGTAAFAGSRLDLQVAPSNGRLVDAFYNVDPAVAVSGGAGSNASMVGIVLTLRPNFRDAKQTQKSRDVAIDQRIVLRNRS